MACAALGHAESIKSIPADAKICDRVYAEFASGFSELRDVMDRCDIDTDAFALALYKFNRLPPPPCIKQISLRTRSGAEAVFRVQLEIDVFFNLFEAYPHQLAFKKLGELTERLSEGFAIEGIEIVGSWDANESELVEMKLATRRAEFLQRYFEATGVKSDLIRTSARAPSHANNIEGSARDRSAVVRVKILREGSSEKK